MKKDLRGIFLTIIAIVSALLILSGCYESRYNRRYHHHSREWYERRHTPPPAGVNFDIDIRR